MTGCVARLAAIEGRTFTASTLKTRRRGSRVLRVAIRKALHVGLGPHDAHGHGTDHANHLRASCFNEDARPRSKPHALPAVRTFNLGVFGIGRGRWVELEFADSGEGSAYDNLCIGGGHGRSIHGAIRAGRQWDVDCSTICKTPIFIGSRAPYYSHGVQGVPSSNLGVPTNFLKKPNNLQKTRLPAVALAGPPARPLWMLTGCWEYAPRTKLRSRLVEY